MAVSARMKAGTFTYAEYLTWPEGERWELIDGVAYAMVPAPSISHQRASRAIFHQLFQALEGGPCEVFYAPIDVRLPKSGSSHDEVDTVVQPDIVVVCDESKLDDLGCVGAPDLVVEVLSPSTALRDRRDKLALYERHRVPEYWILDPANCTLAVYALGADGRYGAPTHYDEGRVEVQGLAGVTVDLGLVFPPFEDRKS